MNTMQGCELDLSGTRYWPVAGSCEHGNEISSSIKGGEFFDSLSNCQILRKGSAPWT